MYLRVCVNNFSPVSDSDKPHYFPQGKKGAEGEYHTQMLAFLSLPLPAGFRATAAFACGFCGALPRCAECNHANRGTLAGVKVVPGSKLKF
eukprot:3066857-Amphidinium_carterae.2